MHNHPDRGGSTAIMQEINSQYHAALSNANNEKSYDDNDNEHIYRYNKDTEQAIIDKINELLNLKMQCVDISLIGTWLWITGNTKPYKAQLGKTGLKCKWHSKRKCWYFHSGKWTGRNSKKETLADLANKYGYQGFKSSNATAIGA